jgi:hypothetical protein
MCQKKSLICLNHFNKLIRLNYEIIKRNNCNFGDISNSAHLFLLGNARYNNGCPRRGSNICMVSGENVYQRRADLFKFSGYCQGYATHERETLEV